MYFSHHPVVCGQEYIHHPVDYGMVYEFLPLVSWKIYIQE